MIYLRVIWHVFKMYLKQIAVDSFVIFTILIQPLIVALLAIYMLRDTAGFEAIYVIVGSGLTGLWSGTLFFSFNNIQEERWSGNLENIIASPTPLATVIIGKSLANTTMSITSMFLGYGLATLFFDFKLTIVSPGYFAISLLLTLLTFISLGLVIAPLISINVGMYIWVNALEYPMYILGGFLFPVALLPAWTTPLSYMLSPYWAAQALHISASGRPFSFNIGFVWALLIIFSIIYWFISTWLFQIILRKAREEATLNLQ